MKIWSNAELEELKINETAYNFSGSYNDGGYIGDGMLSGHQASSDQGHGKVSSFKELVCGHNPNTCDCLS